MKTSALLLTVADLSKAAQQDYQVGMAVNGTRLQLLDVRSDPNVSPMKWYQVRLLDGELAGRTGYVSATNVREDNISLSTTNPVDRSQNSGGASHSAPATAEYVLKTGALGDNISLSTTNPVNRSQNSGGVRHSAPATAEYVLKTGALIVSEPKLATVSDKSKQVGLAITGTHLQLLSESTADGAMRWRKVRILSGDMKEKEGWVSENSLGEQEDVKLFVKQVVTSLAKFWGPWDRVFSTLTLRVDPATAITKPFCVVEQLSSEELSSKELFSKDKPEIGLFTSSKKAYWATWGTPDANCDYTDREKEYLEGNSKCSYLPDRIFPKLQPLLTGRGGGIMTKQIRRSVTLKSEPVRQGNTKHTLLLNIKVFNWSEETEKKSLRRNKGTL